MALTARTFQHLVTACADMQVADEIRDILEIAQVLDTSEAGFINGVTAGTLAASKAVVVDSSLFIDDMNILDDGILALGTGAALSYKDDATNANTAITGVVLGTPVTPAVAADTLFVFNQISNGDILIGGQVSGNSQAAIFVDVSAGTVDLMAAGVRIARTSAAAGLTLGLAGTTLGKLTLSGNTAGVITINTAATAGDWTLTLPPDDGDSGEQLQTNGSGVTTWEGAGSLREVKNVIAEVSHKAQDTLDRLLGTGVYEFTYKEAGRPTTGDYSTVYTGVMAEELPEVMHHNGRIFSPVSAFGELLLAIKGLAAKVSNLESRLLPTP